MAWLILSQAFFRIRHGAVNIIFAIIKEDRLPAAQAGNGLSINILKAAMLVIRPFRRLDVRTGLPKNRSREHVGAGLNI